MDSDGFVVEAGELVYTVLPTAKRAFLNISFTVRYVQNGSRVNSTLVMGIDSQNLMFSSTNTTSKNLIIGYTTEY